MPCSRRPAQPLRLDLSHLVRFRRALSRRMVAAVAVAGLLAGGPALAATACLTQAEAEAEQAVRLHTMMMVVGLSCQHLDVAGTPSLFARYHDFTLRNRDSIAGWERALIGHFKRHSRGNPTRAFDSFRTRLANETSQRAIALTTDVFCATYGAAMRQLMDRKAADIVTDLRQAAALRVSVAPHCEPARGRAVLVQGGPGADGVVAATGGAAGASGNGAGLATLVPLGRLLPDDTAGTAGTSTPTAVVR